jgi:hypothetical protein
MTTPAATDRSAGKWQSHGAAGWLAMTASPTFALMALFAASDAPRMALCSCASSLLSIDGMTAMYLLMSLFHLPPWLKLATAAGRASNR